MTKEQQSDDRHLRYVDIGEFIPAGWHDQQVRVSSYRAYRLPKADLGATEPFDLVGVRGQLVWGRAPYRRFGEWIEPLSGGGFVVHTDVGDMQHTPEGAYLMLATPTELGTADEEARSRLRSALALLRLALGPNVAVSLLSEFIYTVSTSTVTTLQTIRPPDLYPPPDLSSTGHGLIAGLQHAIERLDDQTRNRVELSLQWFSRGSETYGVDGFLMYWFALDMLAMPRSGGLAALHDKMAEIYNLDTATVKAQYRLGRLLGLRDDIVHDGLHPPIHIRVLHYVASVYWDLMLHTVKLSPQFAADRARADGNIDDWFPKPDRRRRH
jgi:hypothetical protein